MSKKVGFFSRLFYLYLNSMRLPPPKIFSLFLVVLISFKSKAQTYNFKNYSTDQGLAQSQVLCIFQDNKGYMWFGTNSGGASRYDGKKFLTLSKNDGLLDDVVFSIIEKDNHQILFGTSKGLSVYNQSSFKNYTEKDGLKNSWIYRLLDTDDGVWIGTQLGVFIFKEDKITVFDKDSILMNSSIYNIFKDRNNNLWFATLQNGVVYYNTGNKTFKHFSTNNGLMNNFVFSIAEKENGNMLIGTMTGLNEISTKFDVSACTEIKSNENIGYSSLLKLKGNDFFIGTYAEGLLTFDFTRKKRKAFYNSTNGLTNNPILSLYTDKEGNLWIGSTNGVYKYYNDKLVYFTKANGLSDNYIDAIGIDSENNIWLSIGANGLSKLSANTVTNYKADFKNPKTLPDNSVKAILPLKNGKIYFGTQSGLCYLENNVFITVEDKNFTKKYIQSLFEDSKGKIWIGTNEGVYSLYQNQISEEKIINTYKKEGMEYMIFFINEDKKGNMFFGLENGLVIQSGTKTTFINSKNNFVDSRVCNSVRDYRGNFWFGTAEGLYFYDHSRFKKILNTANKNIGFITFLQPDNKRRLIIGTNNEIEILDLNAFYSGRTSMKHLGKEEGLLSRESSFNASALDKDGRVLIGTGNGLQIYNPKFDFNNNFEAQTNITDIKLFFGLERIDAFSESTDSFSLLPKNLILPYSKNNLTFQFIGISLVAPEKVMYKYKLQGLDKNWTPPDYKTEAVYPAIPPGTYTFMVQAMNNDGVWNKVPTTYTFKILPPWYSTWWFRILALTVILVSAGLYIRYREKQLIKEKEVLENIVSERTAKISEQKNLIEEKNKEIVDSINYAQRIQRALLASEKTLQTNLPQHFVFFQPKDVVSGDFYWASLLSNGQFVIATADSTGHGVPGAIMSMLNISCLNDSVEAKRLVQPKDILNNTRLRIIDHLANDGSKEGGKDGMDCSLVSFDFKNLKITYSAANNPVWIVRSNNGKKEFIELSYDKMPVGKHDRDKISFTQNTVDLQKGDLVYTLTDGLPDQFGGTKGKKFMYKKLKDLLVSISDLSLPDQKLVLSKTLSDWKGNLEQVDDILIIGIRV